MLDMTNAALPAPHELFKYYSTYQVLICTSCRFALSPGGVARHMKDIHHLHHEQRRPYTLFASNFRLRDPENVVNPHEKDFPIPHLPLEQGWKCTECGYLAISRKRMETHWPPTHGRKGDPSRDWIAAPLQTFFRGNKVRYFTSGTVPDQERLLSLPTASVYIERIRDKYQLDAVDSLTLEHYFYSSYKSFANNETEPIWLKVVADLAHDHLFLLKGILACTALHMAHLYPAQRKTFILRTYAHQDVALPLFRDAIDHPTAQNCDAIMTFAYLLVTLSLAEVMGNANAPLLLVNERGESEARSDALPQWLYFLRSGCVMLCDVWDRVETGPVSALAYAWDVELDRFMSFVPKDGSWSEDIISVYYDAAVALAEAFAYMEQTPSPDTSTWHILGLWPVRVEDEFLELLFQKHPGALILLAHYCIIFKKIEDHWYLDAKPSKLISSITEMLDARYHASVREAEDIVLDRI
ncbi:hypothetical protein N7468_002195 [Penicillium chermesinum]|uniref:C2H2-type domain-containing protein n=1 Tax=Penicillium chermesinum TaxID=63820 RepID=A0A9W9PKY8_9EURO|nr:uncharacterized protein N7468_002195 [Penicillium chermesinum]KAJ5247212.1 hypothetical protein N7468_002195 [Penicillium chermesinum]